MSELKTLNNALKMLRLLEACPASRISDLAAELHISTSAAHRIAATLLCAGVVAQEPGSRRYVLAEGVSLGGHRSTELARVLREAPEHLATLRDQVLETVHLAIRDGLHATFPLALESPRQLRASSRAGTSVPLHSAATGKILLAELADEEIRNLFGNSLNPVTEETITDMDVFLQEIDQIRRQDYANHLSEYDSGVYSLAVPVIGRSGAAVCAIAVSAPMARVRTTPFERNDVVEDRLLEAVRKCADKLSERLADHENTVGAPV